MSNQLPALGAIVYERGFDTDALIRALCMHLSEAGVRLGGLLQVATGPRDGCAGSIEVEDMRTGHRQNIWEDRGACARGCRLDERGLAASVPAIEAAIAANVDLVVINRFGRVESRGAGLMPCIAAAIESNIPVLTAVREPYLDSWRSFHGGLGTEIEPRLDEALRWCLRVSKRTNEGPSTRSLGSIGGLIEVRS